MRRRLDTELVRRGLAHSRTEAARAVRAGLVTVDGRPAPVPSRLVAPTEQVRVEAGPRRFVSRGGDKLAAALDRFTVDPRGIDCLDAGASTGGFTDCLLQRGAARVIAVDVGYGQLDWRIRNDPRVTVLERTNVRDLAGADLPFRPSLIATDLSFISLRLVVPTLAAVSANEARFVLLVKPQFEAGRDKVERGGVVRDPHTWRSVLLAVADACRLAGLPVTAVMPSPLLGPAGNVEFFLLARRAGDQPDPDIEGALAEAARLATGGET